VENQIVAGAQPAPANFGKEVMSRLVEQGLSVERSVRYVGIFYQMRRAFYFAQRDLKGSSLSMQRLRERLWENVFTHDIGLYEQHSRRCYGKRQRSGWQRSGCRGARPVELASL
jgi:hypothetical protein